MNAIRRGTAAAALVVGMCLVAACGGSGNSDSGTKGSADGGSTGTAAHPVKLTYWGSAEDPNKRQVELFNKAHATVKIKYVNVPAAQLGQQVQNATSAGTPPDIFPGGFDGLTSALAQNQIADITPWITKYKGKYLRSAYDSTVIDGKQYAVPTGAPPMVFLYRTDIFKANNLQPPKTWDDLVSIGKVLKKKNIKVTNYAGEDPTSLIQLAWTAGAHWYKAENNAWKIDFLDADSLKAADTIQSLVDDGLISTQTVQDYAAFQGIYDKGTTATRNAWLWSTGGMVQNFSKSFGKWDAATLPSYGAPATPQGISSLFISRKSKYKKAATEAANWLATDPGSVKIVADPAKGLALYPAVADPSPYVNDLISSKLFGANTAHAKQVVLAATKTGVSGWEFGPDYTAMSAELADGWAKVIVGKQTVRQLLQHMQKWTVNDLKNSGVNVVDASTGQ